MKFKIIFIAVLIAFFLSTANAQGIGDAFSSATGSCPNSIQGAMCSCPVSCGSCPKPEAPPSIIDPEEIRQKEWAVLCNDIMRNQMTTTTCRLMNIIMGAKDTPRKEVTTCTRNINKIFSEFGSFASSSIDQQQILEGMEKAKIVINPDLPLADEINRARTNPLLGLVGVSPEVFDEYLSSFTPLLDLLPSDFTLNNLINMLKSQDQGGEGLNLQDTATTFGILSEKLARTEASIRLRCDPDDMASNTCEVMEDCSENSQYCYHSQSNFADFSKAPECVGTPIEDVPVQHCNNNNQIDLAGEECDGPAIAGQCCENYGKTGEVSCRDCKLDLSNCFSLPRQQMQEAKECTDDTGLQGKTGANAGLRLNYDYSWDKDKCIISEVFSESEQDSPNPNYAYCDSTQFVSGLIARLYDYFMLLQSAGSGQIGASALQNIRIPKYYLVALMADGFSSDFKKDFHYAAENKFFATPSFYETYSNMLKYKTGEANPLEFINFLPDRITEPGIYKATIEIEGMQQIMAGQSISGMPTIKIVLEKIADPEINSNFYYLPIDDILGVNKRPDESTGNRIGYGTGFSLQENDVLKIAPGIFFNNSIQAGKTIDARIIEDFDEMQHDQRGRVLNLDLQNKKLDIFESNPTPVQTKIIPNEKPFFALYDSAGQRLTTSFQNYSSWTALAGQNNCDDISILKSGLLDTVESTPQCAESTSSNSFNMAEFPNEIGEMYLGTIFYSRESLVLKSACSNTKFSTPFEKDQRQITILGTTVPKTMNEILNGIKTEKLCIAENLGDKTTKIFWNSKKLLATLPRCNGCQCTNDFFQNQIINISTKPDKIYQNQSITFIAELGLFTPIENNNVELYITDPNSSTEIKSPAVFYDDGMHGDNAPNDGVFAATIQEGFTKTGAYKYKIKLAEPGNESEKTSQFEVYPVGECKIVQEPINPEKGLNIFILGQRFEGKETEFDLVTTALKNELNNNPKSAPYADKINIYSIAIAPELNCSLESVQNEEEKPPQWNCDATKVMQAVLACNIPVKTQPIKLLSDKAVVLINSQYPAGSSEETSSVFPYESVLYTAVQNNNEVIFERMLDLFGSDSQGDILAQLGLIEDLSEIGTLFQTLLQNWDAIRSSMPPEVQSQMDSTRELLGQYNDVSKWDDIALESSETLRAIQDNSGSLTQENRQAIDDALSLFDKILQLEESWDSTANNATNTEQSQARQASAIQKFGKTLKEANPLNETTSRAEQEENENTKNFIELAPVNQEKILLVTLGSLGNRPFFESASIMDGRFLDFTVGKYTGKIFSSEGKMLFEFKFDFAPTSQKTGKGKETKLLKLPYFSNAERIKIFDKNNEMLNFGIGFLAKTCGNSKCESYESSYDCPGDCPKITKEDRQNALNLLAEYEGNGQKFASIFSVLGFLEELGAKASQTNLIFVIITILIVAASIFLVIKYRKRLKEETGEETEEILK